jgi:Mu transposase-like protein
LPEEWRLIRRDGIQMFNIHYWDNVLSPLAGRSSKPVLIKYDPRNLSRVFYRDKDGHYWPIPYRNLGAPPISLWEQREAIKRPANSKNRSCLRFKCSSVRELKAEDRLPVHELSAVNGHCLRFKYRAQPGRYLVR